MTIIALFMIVVVSLLSAVLIKVVSSASNTTISQVYGLRAQLASQAGIERILQVSFPAAGNALACNQTLLSPASFELINGFESCAYEAVCSTESIQFANVDYLYFKFSSTGTCIVGSDVVSRTISVDATEEIIP